MAHANGMLGVVLLSCSTAVAGAAQSSPPTPPPDPVGTSWSYESDGVRFRVDVVATNLRIPWGLAFLPDGRVLFSERPAGRMNLLDVRTGAITRVENVPAIHARADGGMLDVVLHPDYARNGWIYFAYAAELPEGNTTVVERARLRGARLVDRARVFAARPAIANSNHFGCRLVLRDGYLYVALGERDLPDLAQDLGVHHGKVIRVHDDGRVPRDNPFAGRAGALPEIWSYGHRNPQGLAFHPTTGALWLHEHGPRGGDEVNIVRPGRNYGWPAITYGEEYSGGPVGDGATRKDGMEQPLYYYVPSIAPSGMAFYEGDALPTWRGSLFLGAMALRHLNRLVIENGRVVREERLLLDRRWRVREVRQGPDGFLYIGVDSGMILRIRPE